MLNRLAKLVSVIFQPLLMPLYGIFILLNANTWMSYALFPQLYRALYIIVIASTFVMPALTVLLLYQRKQIATLEMQHREERNIPYIATLFFYFAGWFLLYKLPLPRVFGNIILGATFVILIAFLINLRWKISIHMIGLGGLAGMLYAITSLFGYDLSSAIIGIVAIAGITGTARLLLGAHLPSQVYTGFILGFLIEWAFVYVYNIGPYFLK